MPTSNSCMGRNMVTITVLAVALILALVVTTPLVAAAPFPAPDFARCGFSFNSTNECCTLPARHNALKKFSFEPRLPMRTRPAAHLVDDAYIAKYQRAMEKMRALPATDGRSFVAQYRLHCAYCNNHLMYEGHQWPLEIHQNWLFLPWHRLYLYFHERILGSLIDDPDFALPFWNWDNQDTNSPLPNAVPKVYADPKVYFSNAINATSSLFDPDRNPCSAPPRLAEFQTFLPCPQPQDVDRVRSQNAHVLYTQTVSKGVTPLTMHGAPYRFGDLGGVGMGAIESRPHGPVHVWVNIRDMGMFKDSASDPIFFAHHANVDRLWELWKTLPGKYRKDVQDPDYLNTEFTFFDEKGEQVAVSVAQSLDPNLMRYKYQKMPTPWINNGSIQESSTPAWEFCYPNTSASSPAHIIDTTRRFRGPLPVPEPGAVTFKLKRRPRMAKRHGEEMLEIKAKFNWRSQHIVNIFAHLPGATFETNIGCVEYIGDLFSFPHVGLSPDLEPEMTYRIGIRRKLEVMGRANLDHIVITLATGPPPPTAPPPPPGAFVLTSAKIIYSKL